MRNFSRHLLITVWLLAVGLLIQSCNEESVQLEKQKVQFTLGSDASASKIELSNNAKARISVASSSGTSILSDHEISVFKSGGEYITEPVELPRGAYAITDFIIVEDSVELYVAPKQGAELSTSATHA